MDIFDPKYMSAMLQGEITTPYCSSLLIPKISSLPVFSLVKVASDEVDYHHRFKPTLQMVITVGSF